jgi:UV DNA damage endonuclease
MRLGFAVKVLGLPEVPANDTRRWQNSPHLLVSLGYLHQIFDYLQQHNISMYRMSSDLAPYLTHPDMPQFHRQLEESAAELAALGERARSQGLRLSLHPSQYIVLNSPDETLVAKSVADIEAQVALLDLMGLGPEAVVVIHVGGVYNDHDGSVARFITNLERLSAAARRRLVLENDDIRFTVSDVLFIHERSGIPVVYDYHHQMCKPDHLSVAEALARSLATWPAGVRPKIHFSTPRTEMKLIKRKNPATGKNEEVPEPPQWTNHADYINPFEFINVLRQAPPGVPFDVMVEAKAKDVAVLRLRQDLPRYAPDVAARFGLHK